MVGKPYPEIHLWRDEFFPTLGVRHRRKQAFGRLFASSARRPPILARRHIVLDLAMEGCADKPPVSKDEERYVTMGLV